MVGLPAEARGFGEALVRIYTRCVWDEDTGKILESESEWYEYSGPLAECKGATQQMTAVSAAQDAFYNVLTSNYQTQFAKQSAILDSLNAVWGPILRAGPGQTGFTKPQETALRTQATEGTGAEYQKALKAVQANQATRGGGTAVLPSGFDETLKAQVATAAAADEANKQLDITKANYERGYQNFLAAGNVLSGVGTQYNPVGYAGSANTAGADAFASASEIQKANAAASPWGIVGGILGGQTGAAIVKGGFAACWVADELYGIGDPRTNLLRFWLNTEFNQTPFGGFVMNLYVRFGRLAARLVRRFAFIRALFTPLFARALRRAESWAKERRNG